MPLPPAPTQRASRLTHKAFESSEEQTDAPAMVQIETKRSLTSEHPMPHGQAPCPCT